MHKTTLYLDDELDRDLVVALHHVEHLEVDDVHLPGGLEEPDHLLLAVPRDHPGNARLDRGVVLPGLPRDLVCKDVEDGRDVALAERLVDRLHRRQVAHRTSRNLHAAVAPAS